MQVGEIKKINSNTFDNWMLYQPHILRGTNATDTDHIYIANEAVFQMMMLSYNLFLLFKFDFLTTPEYREQIKTFRLKYVFLAGKIIKTARSVIMKICDNYPYREVYETVWYNRS